ncbi:MAG: radical SAM protein [Alphaproteobacteria bacterium]|nr:radical SAM protein [Alphaproteobacteria bacterium]
MATLILKPTEACNAACAYCEVDRKGWRTTKIMPAAILERLFERINEFLEERPDERLEIVWHGGEPLLLGPDYFEKACAFQQEHCAATRGRIRHTIQTNLTLLTPAFIAAFRQLGMNSVGTSYDPVAGVRLLKKGESGAAYNRRFMEAVTLIEREGFRWGVICVVTKLSLERPLDIFHFMTNLAPDGGVMFNPVNVEKPEHDHLKISAEEFAAFLGAIFPAWWQHRARYPRVEPFRSLIGSLLSERQNYYCNDAGNCANTHFNLGPEGRWSHCGRSADWGLLDYGTIAERSISEVFSNAARDGLRRRNEVLSNGECRGCRWWRVCHGGCPLDGHMNTGSLMGQTGWCRARRDFIERTVLPVTGMTLQ